MNDSHLDFVSNFADRAARGDFGPMSCAYCWHLWHDKGVWPTVWTLPVALPRPSTNNVVPRSNGDGSRLKFARIQRAASFLGRSLENAGL
jgi:hypothetical protein